MIVSMNAFDVTAYNVEYGRHASARSIGAALAPYHPDITVFCEVPGGDWTRQAGESLGLEHVVVGEYSTAGHKDKYKSIASRTPLTDYEEVEMSDTLHTATRARTVIDGIELVIYAIHFPFGWRNQAHIEETDKKVRTFFDYLADRRERENAVVMGDFNFVPSRPDYASPYYEWLREIGFDVSWGDLDMDITEMHTCSTFEPSHEGSGNVIDHIAYDPRRLRATNGGIIELDPPLSDHKPVWATLTPRS
jgi:maltose 6'-phosphate phosphatase